MIRAAIKDACRDEKNLDTKYRKRESFMPSLNNHASARRHRSFERLAGRTTSRAIASAYDHAGEDYAFYADGEGHEDPSSGDGRFAHGDGIVWDAIRGAIDDLHASGASTLRILDAGCGPGTWLNRVAAYAHRQGGFDIEAVGVDISKGQLEIAHTRVASSNPRDCAQRCKITFLEHDLSDPLPWPDQHFHIVLCNYAVLNHLPRTALPRTIRDLCRVASHCVIVSVRALASPPTGCITGTEQMRDFRQDCGRGELKVLLKDGTEHRLTFNLYSAVTLRAMFAQHAAIADMRALDLFLSRFAADAKWTSNVIDALPGRAEVMGKLKELEERLCRLPAWLDHGTHILIVAEPWTKSVGTTGCGGRTAPGQSPKAASYHRTGHGPACVPRDKIRRNK